MKTPEEIIREATRGNPIYWDVDGVIKALDAGGYVIRSRQANFNAARMEAALIAVAEGEGWQAEQAEAALKWCEDNPA